ncbi:uncharacterized protein LOC133322745 [Musca vetustissima]|uniref:uncharacterized protein LOC133322745 n=1 Tax=Musca vetustissima TaxID=27455 RepID=UPI002AB7E9AB|nr:uncharacterized protein LOC133322745 [Musca vetustissima]
MRIVFLSVVLVFVSVLAGTTNARYTSEETDEKSKSLYSAVTSILDTSETSKHHRKHTYDAAPSPCSGGTGGCPINVPGFVAPSPCSNAQGCPPLAKSVSHGNSIVYPSPSPNVVHGSSGPSLPSPGYGQYNYGHAAPASSLPPSGPAYGAYGYGVYPPATGYVGVQPPTQPVPQATGYASAHPPTHPVPSTTHSLPPPPSGGYGYSGYGSGAPPSQPANGGAYGGHYSPGAHPGPYGYQGNRGYSVYNHSLKTNSEYTEVGSHTGPLQQAPGGYGYGSGYGGGYNGMFNRPGF